MIKVNVPKTIYELCDILEQNGYPAYLVGGCIRDSLLRQTPKDWDITTSATTEEICKVSLRANENTEKEECEKEIIELLRKER